MRGEIFMKKVFLILMFFFVIILSSCTPTWIKTFGDYDGYSWKSDELDIVIKWETIDNEYSVYMHHNTNNEPTIYKVKYRSSRLVISANKNSSYSGNNMFDSNYKFSNSGQTLILYSITLDKLWKNKYDSITLLKEN